MAPFFTNGTCDPFHPVSKPCTLGNYVVYAVNVSKPEHISKAMQFATKHNIRVVVRNTGHDYNGLGAEPDFYQRWHLAGYVL
jgi:FAD/FMN-containing dehydrogenase